MPRVGIRIDEWMEQMQRSIMGELIPGHLRVLESVYSARRLNRWEGGTLAHFVAKSEVEENCIDNCRVDNVASKPDRSAQYGWSWEKITLILGSVAHWCLNLRRNNKKKLLFLSLFLLSSIQWHKANLHPLVCGLDWEWLHIDFWSCVSSPEGSRWLIKSIGRWSMRRLSVLCSLASFICWLKLAWYSSWFQPYAALRYESVFVCVCAYACMQCSLKRYMDWALAKDIFQTHAWSSNDCFTDLVIYNSRGMNNAYLGNLLVTVNNLETFFFHMGMACAYW